MRIPDVLVDAVADAKELGQARRHRRMPTDLRGRALAPQHMPVNGRPQQLRAPFKQEWTSFSLRLVGQDRALNTSIKYTGESAVPDGFLRTNHVCVISQAALGL